MAVVQMVTLAQAKAHLRVTTPDGHPDDADLQLKIDAATAMIRRHVGRSAYGQAFLDVWQDPSTTDQDAQAAVLLQLAEFWRFRGDDPRSASPERDENADLSPVLVGLLRRFSHAVLA